MKKKSVNIKNALGKMVYWLVFLMLLGIASLVAVSSLDIPGSYKLLVVQSGSMEPAIDLGSIVVVRPVSEYKLNDVITYSDSTNPKYTITHRVIGVEYLENGKLFITKGDANDAEDRQRIEKNLIIGKVEYTIPLVGYIVSFAKTQTGLITLIVIPATLIIYSETVNIKNEVSKLLAKKSTQKRKKTQLARAREIRRRILEMKKITVEK